MAAVITRADEPGAVPRTVFFGLLNDVASDPQVTDLAVTCNGRVWADRGNGMRETVLRVPFRSPQVVREYAVQLCAQLGRRLDDACPIADAASPDGIRVHAVIAPLVPQGAAISIRFPDRTMASLRHLSQLGVFPAAWLPMFVGLVRRHATVLITGGTGVGKTTLLKALLAQCDVNERIVTVEEVRELGELGRGDHVSLVTREANVEGVGAISLTDLVKATLRMRPDRVVLGECRGAEIVDLLRVQFWSSRWHDHCACGRREPSTVQADFAWITRRSQSTGVGHAGGRRFRRGGAFGASERTAAYHADRRTACSTW